MSFPKLKYPRLCRITSYVVVLGIAALPTVVACAIPGVPEGLRVVILLASLVGLLVYLFKNFMALMMLDMGLTMLACYDTARTRYALPAERSSEKILRSAARWGKGYDPTPLQPRPAALRYRFSAPATVYNSGTERVLAVYETAYLTKDAYREIFSSAKANSNALRGRKKALFLDAQQKKAPLSRVTVVLILARQVDPRLSGELYELVCKQCGDEHSDCLVPCVVDLSGKQCVFNCLRQPYVGLGYPVKNHGIRLVKRVVFGGRLPLTEQNRLTPKGLQEDMGDTLWSFWRAVDRERQGSEEELTQMYEALPEKQVVVRDGQVLVKLEGRCICQELSLDEEEKLAIVDELLVWTHPKINDISKAHRKVLTELIEAHFRQQGYRVRFSDKG